MLMSAAVTELHLAAVIRLRAVQPLGSRWRIPRMSPQNRPRCWALLLCNPLIVLCLGVPHGTVRPTPPSFLPEYDQPSPTTAPSKNGRGFGGGVP